MSDDDVRPARMTRTAREADVDAALTRSEEHLRIASETVPVGRLRLRKYLVVEERTFTVPVTREEIAVDYEDIPPSEQLPDGSEPLSEYSYEMVRYEERVVLTRQLVAVERVRMTRHVVTVDQVVTGRVRREVVDIDQVDDRDDSPALVERPTSRDGDLRT